MILAMLQESDMFMDAMMSACNKKEPRKRKRRSGSLSKDDKDKKDLSSEENMKDSTPPSSPTKDDTLSPINVKPVTLKVLFFFFFLYIENIYFCLNFNKLF